MEVKPGTVWGLPVHADSRMAPGDAPRACGDEFPQWIDLDRLDYRGGGIMGRRNRRVSILEVADHTNPTAARLTWKWRPVAPLTRALAHHDLAAEGIGGHITLHFERES